MSTHIPILLVLFTTFGCSQVQEGTISQAKRSIASETTLTDANQNHTSNERKSVDIRNHYSIKNPLRTQGVNAKPGCGHVFVPLAKHKVEAALLLAQQIPENARTPIPDLHPSVELAQSIRDLAEEAYLKNNGRGPVNLVFKQRAYALLFQYLLKREESIKFDIVSWNDPTVFYHKLNQKKVKKLSNSNTEGSYIRLTGKHTGELLQAIKIIDSHRSLTHLGSEHDKVSVSDYQELSKSKQAEIDYEDTIQYYLYNLFGKKNGGSYVYGDEKICNSALLPNPSSFQN